MLGDDVAEHGSVGGDKVHDAIGKPGVTEDLVDEVVRQDGGITRLPDDSIALFHTFFYSGFF